MARSFHSLQLYRCVVCRSGALEAAGDGAQCVSCGAFYPVRHNVLDTLVRPSEEVKRELRGMAVEAGMSAEEWETIRIRKLDRIRTFSARLEESIDHPVQYYQQTWAHFEQALNQMGVTDASGLRVLEIGSETDYPFLRQFRDLGAYCHAVNVFFAYQEPDPYLEFPEKTLADMNDLPFLDNVFDIVLMSGTSHHSPDLEKTIRELSRVLKPGGAAWLSDPVDGWLKKLGKRGSHDRHGLIHENEYSIFRYRHAFECYGLNPEYLFSSFYDEKLRTGRIHSKARFAGLGRLVSGLWKNNGFRALAKTYLLLPVHILFGFPMNVVVRKKLEAARQS